MLPRYIRVAVRLGSPSRMVLGIRTGFLFQRIKRENHRPIHHLCQHPAHVHGTNHDGIWLLLWLLVAIIAGAFCGVLDRASGGLARHGPPLFPTQKVEKQAQRKPTPRATNKKGDC